jgi:GT2 family glycosyltransferase/glycosyltransferase involved in cell wall biosynthesis
MSPAPLPTVLIPVYRGIDEVRACIESVLRHGAREPFALTVINDASPEPSMDAYLASVASATNPSVELTVLTNEENLGFVGTVNRGLGRSSGDVVILNADTVVTAGWLDRLLDAAAVEPDVATVTPVTNFGSICTVPRSVASAFALDGNDPQIDACAAFVEANGLGHRPEVITGVGFCMLMTRQALDACGPFDEKTFGRGYGEEVDFCLRATRQGFRNIVEDRTFVYHHGAVSFGSDREAGLERGSMLIRDRYPFFRPSNRKERFEDPLAVTFAALELGLAERRVDRPHVLHILHSAPDALGGTEKHLGALIDALLPDMDFSVLHPVPSGFVLRTYWMTGEDRVIHHEFLLPGAPRRVTRVRDENAAAALRMAFDMFDFDAVHIQNLIGHSLAPLTELADFPGTVVCSVRDPFLACPSHALMYRGQAFCGIPEDLSYCSRCLPETRQVDLNYLAAFRRTVAEHLDAVDTWVFASQSAADLLLRVYDLDDERIEIIPHGAIVDPQTRSKRLDETLLYDEPLRVAFVGLGRAKKGLETVNWLADRLDESDIEIHHFGNLLELASDRVHLHGSYDNLLLPGLLEEAGIHIVLLPGQVSETFGHVMTEALIAGRPVIAASYGALGERIRATGAGWTIDPTDATQVLQLLKDLSRCRDEVRRAMQAALDADIRSVAAGADQYGKIYLGGER